MLVASRNAICINEATWSKHLPWQHSCLLHSWDGWHRSPKAFLRHPQCIPWSQQVCEYLPLLAILAHYILEQWLDKKLHDSCITWMINFRFRRYYTCTLPIFKKVPNYEDMFQGNLHRNWDEIVWLPADTRFQYKASQSVMVCVVYLSSQCAIHMTRYLSWRPPCPPRSWGGWSRWPTASHHGPCSPFTQTINISIEGLNWHLMARPSHRQLTYQ